MEISARLEKIVDLLPKSEIVADIGTDHGYVLIELLRRKKIRKGIASDNKKGPLERALRNAEAEMMSKLIDFRLGSGFETLKTDEVDGAVIAGMGGQLICELLENAQECVRSMNFLLLQPAQNPEILREYLYQNQYEIIDEELVREDRRYYEYLLVKYAANKAVALENHSGYVVGDLLLRKKHPLLKEYIDSKITTLEETAKKINTASENAEAKKERITEKISELRRIRDGSFS